MYWCSVVCISLVQRWQKESLGSLDWSEDLRNVQLVLLEMSRLSFFIFGSTFDLRIEVNWFSQSLIVRVWL